MITEDAREIIKKGFAKLQAASAFFYPIQNIELLVVIFSSAGER